MRFRPQTSGHIQAYQNWTACGNALCAEPFFSFEEPPGYGISEDSAFAVGALICKRRRPCQWWHPLTL